MGHRTQSLSQHFLSMKNKIQVIKSTQLSVGILLVWPLLEYKNQYFNSIGKKIEIRNAKLRCINLIKSAFTIIGPTHRIIFIQKLQ